MLTPKKLPSKFSSYILAGLGLGLVFATKLSAATVVWSGASGTDTNWSNSANWVGGAPSGADDVKFYDNGTNGAPGTPNMLVDAAFSGYIGSLQFAQSNGWHTIQIADGKTLYITNANGLYVGTITNVGAVRALTNSIKGTLGATLNVTNPAASIVLNQGETNALNGARAILDLSGLDNFNATVYAMGLGSLHFPAVQGAAGQRNSGTLFLARTNVITLGLTDTLANYSTLGNRTNALEMVHTGSGNNAATLSLLVLGQTNAFYVDSFGFGRSKASASSAAVMSFNPAFANPSAFFRGVGGSSSRVTWWSIGDMADNASSAQVSVGTNDFSLGTVNALVDTLSLARDCTPQHTSLTGNNIGVLTFTAGTIDANNVIVGNQVLGPASSFAGNIGIVNVNGATAKLVANNTLTLGRTTVTYTGGAVNGGTNALRTQGFLNIRNGGTVLANSIAVGASSSNCVVTLSNATLVVSNGIASPAKGLTYFNVTNSTLTLNITGITNVFCTNLVSAGITNIINLNSVSIFSAYPKQIPLIKYVNQLGLGITNFGLGTVPASAPGAYLSNNVANSSLDLVLPFDPRPVITAQPATYSGNPGDNVTFNVSVSANSATPPTYQWYLGATPVANGPTGNGSTNFGSTTASLVINNAQPGDNGSYTVVITNAYGSATSAPPAVLTISAGNVAPSLTGPNNTTVIQGDNATFSASASGNPAPAMQWQRNGVNITGQTSSSYTLTNAQYLADDGAVFSLIATNAAGSVTNSATLTVIVPPAISVQPVSQVVTNTQAASFSVTVSGVPSPTFQWSFNNTPISGATNSTYNLASATSANIGTYKVALNNAAGSATSSNATLIVNSTMSATAFSPSNGATGICYDTPLTVTFSFAPTLGSIGTIKIYNVTNSVTPVDTITIASGSVQSRNFPGDGQAFAYQTIQISGSTAKIYPHFSVLSSNATYYVTIDNGAFTDGTGAYFAGITATNIWQFTTKVGGPVNGTNPVVNADGSADFVTVQGAVNSLATGTNATQRVISIRNGLYNEIVDITGKHNVTLRGQSRSGAVIYFPNNNIYQVPVNGGTTHARMTFKVNANDIVLDSLTVSNSTPQGGSQAEALMIESSAKRCIVYNSELDSRQDTILGNQNSSQTYFYQTIVKGNFDYIWGGGNFFFDKCTIQTIAGASGFNLTAARTDTSVTTSANFPWANPGGSFSANGMSFVNCTFTADSGVGTVTLAGGNGTAGNNVSWYGCDFATNYIAPSAALFSGNYVFWQAENTSNGVPVTYPVLIALSGNDARLLAATNIPTWFYGWSPQLAPNILTQPTNQTANVSNNVSFSVVATGIPDASYQWFQGASPVAGATSATLTITNVHFSNAGSYSVVVSNSAGTVTSTSATLTVPNRSPVAAVLNISRPAGLSLNLTLANLGTNWSDADGDILTLSGINLVTTNGVNLATNGISITYPNSANVNDQFSYTISDGQGGTGAGLVNIVIDNSIIATNSISSLTFGTTNLLTATGLPGYTYVLERATNLAPAIWLNIATNVAAPNGIINATDDFSDVGGLPPGSAFYRFQWQR